VCNARIVITRAYSKSIDEVSTSEHAYRECLGALLNKILLLSTTAV